MAGFSIPEDFPLGALASQELTNISIGRHYVRLLFVRPRPAVAGIIKYEDGASIDIEAGFRLETSSGQVIVADNADLATGAGSLIALLGHTIVSTDRRPNNELGLVFSNGSLLQLTVDEQGFESYHLDVDGQSVDVTKVW